MPISSEVSGNVSRLPIPDEAQARLRLMHMLVQAALRRDRAALDILGPFKLSLTQWRLMLYISFAPDATMGEVADYVAIDRTSLTRAVDKLVSRNLVLRAEPLHDRRMTMLRLSPAGRQLCEKAFSQFVDHSEWLLEGLNEDDLKRSMRVLEGILARLIGHRSGVRRVLDLF